MGTAIWDNSPGGYLKPDRIPQAFIRRVAAAIAFGASLFGATAMGQQAPAASPELQEIVVTGTMIKRPNAETAEAITILKTDALKDLGITSVEEALNQLTGNAPAINVASSVGSFSGGGTYANLRDL